MFPVLFLTACGFTPVYQKGEGSVREKLAAITIDTPNTREAQWLRSALEDRMAPGNEAAAARYRLTPNFSVALEPLSIESDGTTRRYRMLGTSDMVLSDLSTGAVVLRDRIRRFSSYHISDEDYSTYVAGQDATRQLTEAMAEELRLRIIAFLAQKP